MTVQAATIVDVRADGASAMTTWLRDIGFRQVQLVCGRVMFSYILLHFFNYAQGNVSYSPMEIWLTYRTWFWRIPTVNAAHPQSAPSQAELESA